ncbi:MAG: hypothetical protein ACOC8B_04700 [Gemmatimonadota bacterium]
MAGDDRVPVRLVFADSGSFHDVTVRVSAAVIERYERLIDALREEPDVMGEIYVDDERLVAAYVLHDADAAAEG